MSRRPSPSVVLLGLGLAFVASVPLAWWLGKDPVPESPTPLTLVEAPEPEDPWLVMGPEGYRIDPDAIERDPIAVADSGMSLDWVVTGDEARAEAPVADVLPADLLDPVPVPERRAAPTNADDSTPGTDTDTVADYLDAVDFALSTGVWWDDPHAEAQQVLSGLMQGDASGLAAMRQSQEQVLARVRAINAPPEASAHHVQTQRVLSDGIALLETWEAAIEAGDPAALANSAAKAEQLKRDAAKADALATALR